MSIYLSIVKYLIASLFFSVVGLGYSFLDAFLKCDQSGIDGKRSFTSKKILRDLDDSLMQFVWDCVDFGGLLRI